MLSAIIPKFAFFAFCSGLTVAVTVTLTATVVLSTGRSVGFTYAFTGAPTCSVTLTKVSVLVGARTLPVNQNTLTGSAYVGFIPTSAGALPIGTLATVSATFSTKNVSWCDTCTIAAATVTAAATIA